MARDINALMEKMIRGDRVAIGQAMTLIESTLLADRKDAVELLELCSQRKSSLLASTTFAVSGSPGAGKSTLIEALGKRAIADQHKVGVITIDPSSSISRGSILGDKSRMPYLSTAPEAFVRPSPAGDLLGGIGRRTHELTTLLGAIGFDLVFIETVGVGQSEHLAWQLTDGFILVIQPGGGDELQGIKRGITELADIVVVNKADGQLLEAAKISKSHYHNAIHYLNQLRDHWTPQVLTSSAISEGGIEDLWQQIRLYMASLQSDAHREDQRKKQESFWLQWSVGTAARDIFLRHPAVNQKLTEGLLNIKSGVLSAFRNEYEIELMMNMLTTSDDMQKGRSHD